MNMNKAARITSGVMGAAMVVYATQGGVEEKWARMALVFFGLVFMLRAAGGL